MGRILLPRDIEDNKPVLEAGEVWISTDTNKVWIGDIELASSGSGLWAPIDNPVFTGTVTAPVVSQTLTSEMTYAAFGSELLTSDGWSFTEGHWTGDFANGFTHVAGNTTALTNTLIPEIGSEYYIYITVSNLTTGIIALSFGGIGGTLDSSRVYASTATSTKALSIVPTGDFDGTIKVSIKKVNSNRLPHYIVKDNSPTPSTVLELRSSTFGRANTFIGLSSGKYFLNAGIRNVSVGTYSMGYAAGGNYNTALGHSSLTAVMAGANDNTAIGHRAMERNLTGAGNTALGSTSLTNNKTGSENTSIGYNALSGNETGGGSVGVGHDAGRYLADGLTSRKTGDNGIYIGRSTKSKENGTTNEIVIGFNAIGNGSNTVTIGDSNITDTYLRGNILQNGININTIFESLTNKVTSISAESTDVQYPTAKLLFDQLALKAPVASPTFTGTVEIKGSTSAGVLSFSSESDTDGAIRLVGSPQNPGGEILNIGGGTNTSRFLGGFRYTSPTYNDARAYAMYIGDFTRSTTQAEVSKLILPSSAINDSLSSFDLHSGPEVYHDSDSYIMGVFRYAHANKDTDGIVVGSKTNIPLSLIRNGNTVLKFATDGIATLTGSLNATTGFLLNGTDINTAGTLSKVAYKEQNNNFTTDQSIAGKIFLTGTSKGIYANTGGAEGEATGGVQLSGSNSGGGTITRGADLTVYGINHPTDAGNVLIRTANNAGSKVKIVPRGVDASTFLIDESGNVSIKNAPISDALNVTGNIKASGNINAETALQVNGTNIFSRTNTWSNIQTFSNNIIMNTAGGVRTIFGNTTDASTHTGELRLTSADGVAVSKGGYIMVCGNAHATYPGNVRLVPGIGGLIQSSGNTEIAGNLSLNSTARIFRMGPDSDGSWQFAISGGNLVIQKKESGTWTTKGTFLA